MMMEEKAKKAKHDPNENHALFRKYVIPNLDEIRSLVFFYSANKQEVDANYNFVLTEMYKYVHTYDTSKPLKTWIHIVAKRGTQLQNKKQSEENAHRHGIPMDYDYENGEDDEVLRCGGCSEMLSGSLIDNLSDKVFSALRRTSPQLLSAFLLYFKGHSYKEIVDIEYNRGYIDHNGQDAVKAIQSRIYMAKKEIKKLLNEYGITRSTGLD